MIALDLREEARRFMPVVPVLPRVRQAAIATWRGRMINESASSAVFAALSVQLERAGASAADVSACETFSREEQRHGVLCGAVVEALGGEARAFFDDPAPFPQHEDVAPLEGALRNVLSVGCLSETVAVALIGAEREEMPDGALRGLLTRIWADEIGHSRFGWRFVAEHVPSLGDAARARLGAYLAVAFRSLEEHELDHLPAHAAPPVEGKQLGLCDGRSARKLFYATVTDVIIPRLEQLGLPARLAWEHRHPHAALALSA